MSYETDKDSINLLANARESLGLRGQLFERYRNHLKLLAALEIGRNLQGKADPSDLVQETFLDAHDCFSQFRGSSERELGRWLRTILAHRVTKFVRRYCGTQRRDIRLERELYSYLEESSQRSAHDLEGSQSSPSQVSIRREMALLATDALQRLPDHYREVLILRHFRGWTFEEIAARLNRTPDSVKHLWWRALGILRQQMRVNSCQKPTASPRGTTS